MIRSYSASIFAVLLLVAATDESTDTSSLQSINSSAEVISVVHTDVCKNDPGTIARALEYLSSGDHDQISQARNTLLNIAQRSNDCKKAVVRSLMDDMDQPNLNFERQSSNYYLWREGSELLGELKAIEALDLLISHLDLTNGFHSSSMVFQPAILGIRKMGQAAIPKLALALQHDPKARIRMAAVYCLTEIGGVSAMNALKQAQEGESNSCVANFIKISLNTFSYKSKGGTSFDNQAPQANADARQSWLMAFQCIE